MKMKLLSMGLLCSVAFLCPSVHAVAAMNKTAITSSYFADAPVALPAAEVKNTTFGAQWTAVAGAVSYRLDVSTTPFGDFGTEDYVLQNLFVGSGTYYTVANLEPGTPYYYRVRAVDSEGTSDNSNTISTITTAVTTWTGTEWSDGTPTANVNAIIGGAYDNALNGSFTSASLTVNATGSLIVRAGSNMTVINGLTNNSNPQAITIENNANLLQLGNTNNNSGAITVNRNASMRRLDYVYWSAPVSGQNVLDFSDQTLPNRFYTVNETTNHFEGIVPATTDFVPANGYVIRAPNNFPTAPQTFNGTFTGVPNSGNIAVATTLNGPGFNLIGNPYPSTIDAGAFLDENPNISTLYFWTHTQQVAAHDANYATINATGETSAATTELPSATPNGTIQTGQGFIAQVTAAGNAVFTNSMRVANNSDQFFRNATNEKNRLWLSVADAEGVYNQVLVGYVSGATDAVDNQYDGQMIDPKGTRLYSTINNETPYVIQGKALPFSDTDSISLGFMAAEAGNYTIALDHFDGLFAAIDANQAVFLKDNFTGIVTDIKAGNYSFASEAGNFTGRFTLVFQNTTLGIQPVGNISAVIAYTKASALYVNSANSNITAISVYDISGRLLYDNKSVDNTKFEINSLQATQSLLMVQVTTEEGVITTKKVIF